MSEVKTLTLSDIQRNGGTVTDEMLDPFITGETDADKDHSRDTLRRSVSEHVRYLDHVDRDVKAERLNEPILSTPEEDESTSDSDNSEVPPAPQWDPATQTQQPPAVSQ